MTWLAPLVIAVLALPAAVVSAAQPDADNLVDRLRSGGHDFSANRLEVALRALEKGDLRTFREIRQTNFCQFSGISGNDDLKAACKFLQGLDLPKGTSSAHGVTRMQIEQALGHIQSVGDGRFGQCDGYGCYNVWDQGCQAGIAKAEVASRDCTFFDCVETILDAARIETDCSKVPRRLSHLAKIQTRPEASDLTVRVSRAAIARMTEFAPTARGCRQRGVLPIRCLGGVGEGRTYDQYRGDIDGLQARYARLGALFPQVKVELDAELAVLLRSAEQAKRRCVLPTDGPPPPHFLEENGCSPSNMPTVAANSVVNAYRSARQTLSDFENIVPQCRGMLTAASNVDEDVGSACATALMPVCSGNEGKTGGADTLGRATAWLMGRHVVDQSSSLWLAAQPCTRSAFGVERATELAVSRSSKWQATAAYEEIATCLDRCALTAEGRRQLEAMEQGRGYSARITRTLGEAQKSVAAFSLFDEAEIHRLQLQVDGVAKEIAARSVALGPAGKGLAERQVMIAGELREKAATTVRKHILSGLSLVDERLRHPTADAMAGVRAELDAFATIVTNHAAVLQDGAELEKKIAQRGAQLTQRLREMEEVKEAEAKANERLERITSLRADLCQTTDSLGRLHAAERFQRRVDQASDTESPYTRRQNAAAVLVLSDRKKKDVQELRSLGADFNVRRDCATVGTGDE